MSSAPPPGLTMPLRAAARLALLGLFLACGAASQLDAAELKLAWDSPTTNTDGTALTDLSGYRLYYGNASRTYTATLDLGLVTNTTVSNLQAGRTYYFAVTASNEAGRASPYSAELAWTAPPEAPVDHLAWEPMASPQTSGVPFTASISARNAANVVVAGFTGTVHFAAQGSWTPLTGKAQTSSSYPMRAGRDKARTQVIYLKNEVGRAGWIKALALDVKSVPGQALENWTIRMRQTALASYSSTSEWEETGWTTVYRKSTAVTSTGWVEFAFAKPFYYSGTSNLMVDFSFSNTNHSSSGHCRYTTATQLRRLSASGSGTSDDPLVWSGTSPDAFASTAIPNIRLQVDGPLTVSPADSPSFTSGVWTGRITMWGEASTLVIKATDAAGHTGSTSTFTLCPMIVPPLPPPDSTAVSLLLDSDGDGMTDREEAMAGTDPYDAGSVLQMQSVIRSSGTTARGVVLQWTSQPGRSYTIQQSTNLTAVPAFSTIVSNVPGDEPVTVYTDATATGNGPYFYRIQVAP